MRQKGSLHDEKMKSFTALLLTLVLALALTACGGKQDDSKPDDKPDGTVTMTAQEVQQAADTAAAIDAAWSGIFGSASNQITVK